MSVRVPWNAGVTQTENEPVSLLISEHEGLVGDLAVSGNSLERIAQGLRRRHDVIKQPDFARIESASQREANTVVLQRNCRLVQKRDLASHTQALFRFDDQLRRQSHTPQKRRHRHASAFEARDSQAGKAPSRHLEGKSRSEFSAEEVGSLILDRPPEAIAAMAARNKCLAQSNKSRAGGKATKTRNRQ